jgi:regulatory subunit for Cdc7p protein kinase
MSRHEKRQADDLVVKEALRFGMKIWNMYKLESVLDRCMSTGTFTATPIQPQGTPVAASGSTHLKGLLESERRGGPLERDPTQKRHDFRYFSKGSYFVLVEDMWQQLAPVAIQEYTVKRDRDGTERGDWPMLHCHPCARGPFIEFDERERRKWEKQERQEREQEAARASARKRSLERRRKEEQLRMQAQTRRAGDLRRTVSLANLRRHESNPEVLDLDADGSFAPDSANASGYLASGPGNYTAASGNSVGITSTTGTTSTVGNGIRGLQLPASLQEKLQRQVVTSRKFSTNGDADKENACVMGPPSAIPERRQGFLKKAKSTNTLRLPKREEGSKPGYCESCRAKFEDFTKVHFHRSSVLAEMKYAHFQPPTAYQWQ